MRRSTVRTIKVVLAATAILLGGALAAEPAAMAGSGYITVVGNATSPPDNPGLLSIGLEASSAITSVQVQIAFGSTSYAPPALHLTGGTTTNGTWTVPAPITSAELPLGDYYVYVTAADSGGDSITDVQVSQWNFNIQPALTLSATPDQVSADGQTVTISGTATGVYPDSTAPTSQPLAGQAVEVSTQGEIFGGVSSWSVTTAKNGSFSVTTQTGMSSTTETDTFAAEVAQTSTMAQAISPTVTIEPIKAPVRVTATVTPQYPIWDQPVTMTGSVTVEVDGSWVPLPDPYVTISNSQGPIPATVSSSGQFTTALESYEVGPWQVQASGGASDPYAGSATVSVPAQGPYYQGALTGFTATIDKYGNVSVTGCAENTTMAAVGVPAATRVDVQYAAKPSGPWRTLGSIDTTSAACGTNAVGGHFSGSLPGQLASAYYRAAVTSDQTYFAPTATSSAVPASIIVTRFVSFAATPHRVKRGAKITVSGVLQALGKSWRGYGDQVVEIILRPAGSSHWYVAYRVKANRSGHFSKTFADKFGTATWSADYNGNSTHAVTGAATVRIRVT